MKELNNVEAAAVNGAGATDQTAEQIIRSGGCVFLRN
jgi:hypothetical protein